MAASVAAGVPSVSFDGEAPEASAVVIRPVGDATGGEDWDVKLCDGASTSAAEDAMAVAIGLFSGSTNDAANIPPPCTGLADAHGTDSVSGGIRMVRMVDVVFVQVEYDVVTSSSTSSPGGTAVGVGPWEHSSSHQLERRTGDEVTCVDHTVELNEMSWRLWASDVHSLYSREDRLDWSTCAVDLLHHTYSSGSVGHKR